MKKQTPKIIGAIALVVIILAVIFVPPMVKDYQEQQRLLSLAESDGYTEITAWQDAFAEAINNENGSADLYIEELDGYISDEEIAQLKEYEDKLVNGSYETIADFNIVKQERDSFVEELRANKEAAIEAAASQQYYSYSYSGSYDMPTSGLTQSGGVNYYDGRRETYYSSNVLYHYRTGEWTVDNEGFYRTDEGYYVVAASDMSQGTVFEGSKGECIVLDSGCAAGTTDYYVAW